jgi:hypothetical protein
MGNVPPEGAPDEHPAPGPAHACTGPPSDCDSRESTGTTAITTTSGRQPPAPTPGGSGPAPPPEAGPAGAPPPTSACWRLKESTDLNDVTFDRLVPHTVNDNFVCAICLNVMIDPVFLVPCGHAYDRECITLARQRSPSTFTCPRGCRDQVMQSVYQSLLIAISSSEPVELTDPVMIPPCRS